LSIVEYKYKLVFMFVRHTLQAWGSMGLYRAV